MLWIDNTRPVRIISRLIYFRDWEKNQGSVVTFCQVFLYFLYFIFGLEYQKQKYWKLRSHPFLGFCWNFTWIPSHTVENFENNSKRKWLRLFDKFVNIRLRISGWLKKKRWWERLINIRLAIVFYSTGKEKKREKSRITSGSETNVIHFWVSPSVSRSFISWQLLFF
jgi:hypothetical protein